MSMCGWTIVHAVMYFTTVTIRELVDNRGREGGTFHSKFNTFAPLKCFSLPLALISGCSKLWYNNCIIITFVHSYLYSTVSQS